MTIPDGEVLDYPIVSEDALGVDPIYRELHQRHELPFAGIKESGYGHDETIEFSREKGVVIAMPWADGGGGSATIFSQLD